MSHQYAPRLRIAHLAPPASDVAQGVLHVVVNVAASLARRGHHVEVWRTHPWPQSQEFAAVIRPLWEAGVHDVEVPMRSLVQLGRQGVRSVRQRSVDILHMHSVFVPQNAAVARVFEGPLAFSPHGGYSARALQRSRVRKRLYLSAVERPWIKRSAVAFALSAVEAEDLRRQGVPSSRIRVVANGVVLPREQGSGESFRREVGLTEGERLALFVGRLDIVHKGLDRVIAALTSMPGWRLALVGPDHRGGADLLEQRASEAGITEQVVFVGPRYGDELDAAYAGADLFVMGSRWEGQPLALLEGLAHGLPALVTTPVEAAVGVAAAGAGWVATGSLADAWARAAAEPPEQWEARRQAARAVAKGHSWDTVVQDYERGYETACT